MKKLSILLLSISFLSACEKEVLIEGPAGPRGEPGNANVRSGTYEVSEWVYDELSYNYVGEIEVPFVSEDIIANGAILVYARTSENSYSQLPITFFPMGYSTTIEVVSIPGKVQLYWYDSDFTRPVPPFVNTFKVVAIESYELFVESGVDSSDYEALKREFQLQ